MQEKNIRRYTLEHLQKTDNPPIFIFDIDNLTAFTLGNRTKLTSSGKWKTSCMAGESRSVQWAEVFEKLNIDAERGGGQNFEVIQNIAKYLGNGVRNFLFFSTESNIPSSKLIRMIQHNLVNIDPEIASQIRIYIVQANENEVLEVKNEIDCALNSMQELQITRLVEKKSLDLQTGTYFDYSL